MWRIHPFALLFPAALVAGISGVVLKVMVHFDPESALADTDQPLWHGHEMVFGFAYAVIAGYLVARPSAIRSLLLIISWLAGRSIMFLQLPAGAEAVLALCFPILLFALAGLPFIRAAKKGRNLVFAPLLGGLVIAEAVSQIGLLDLVSGGAVLGIQFAMNLVALLMLAMGGRIIAAATSGAHQRLGRRVFGVAHPRIDALGMASLAAVAILDVFDLWPALSATLTMLAAVLIVSRLYLWRVWRTLSQLEISLLHLGYFWLAISMFYVGVTQLFSVVPKVQAMHALMLGAFGTLSVMMMIRVSLQRMRLPISVPVVIRISVAAISISAIARIAAIHSAYWLPLITVAAISWISALLCALSYFAYLPVRLAQKPTAPR